MPLVVHFLNVGQGDCTVIEFPSGRVAMIDIDNLRVLDRDTQAELLAEFRESADYLMKALLGSDRAQLEADFLAKAEAELTDPLQYYDRHIGQYDDLFRFIATHPDMDHITGLYRLHHQDSSKSIENFWHIGPDNFNLTGTVAEDWAASRYDKRDWDTYKELRRSTSTPKALEMQQGSTGQYWTDDGIELWAPTSPLVKLAVEKNEPNIASMILKITYRGVSVVLGGDATSADTWTAIYPTLNMAGVNVLKASHHGRKTGFHWPSVKEMAPWLTITSVGEKEHDATGQYRCYSEHTVSLRKAGDTQITVNDNGTWCYSPNVAKHWKDRIK